MNTAAVTDSPHYPNLVRFMEGVNLKVTDYWKRNGFVHMKAPVVKIASIGKRYAKLANFEDRKGDGKLEVSSVYCFYDLNTGDLLKAATWSAPAPNGVRGNVNDQNVLDKFTNFGPVYRR